ncbi:hypothetical protein CkaCkLH20_05091 [Colletotrichum karsti]|uniref:IDI-2 n=1 Tax=Colletotrichum karsti TaxID=1095194 RepID=A0A9P6I910_9PEZI|nr:uncharacterized protein CkaCkLH20_05091 [Colletotrichum karsti]KAF9877391.1 hypothetical protein CkaCkLH20_05091 [Colletotrichum karsti]
MKFGTILALLFATPILAGVAPATAADECGALGVMTYTAAGDTKGVDPAQIRKCLEHPLGANPRPEGTIPRPEASSADGGGGRNMNATDTAEHWWWHKHGYGWKSCWDVDPGEYGCSRGYCYKACDGDGRWCWTARNQGYGSWKTCDAKADCREVADVACGKKCRACGCSC